MVMVGTFWLFLVLVFVLQVEGTPLVQDTDGNTHESLRFLALADWGGVPYKPYTTQIQIKVAQQMGITAERENAGFILSLGDNIYFNGVKSVHDDRFQTTFENVYDQDSLQIPWYLIAGNHDHYGSVQAQIERSSISHRWNFPDFYYNITKTLPGGRTLDILLLDTVVLCGQTQSTPKGKRIFGPKNVHAAKTQWTWIERHLKKSKADYLLVGGHYPVYSAGSNGPTKCLYSRLEPLLYKYRVTAYLAGHDHNFQHIQTHRDGQNMDYFIIGNGASASLPKTFLHAIPNDSLKFFFAKDGGKDKVGGFALCDVSDTRMKIRFIDSNGVIRYEYDIKPRKLE